jgi:phosphatidate cytidylyltransferase
MANLLARVLTALVAVPGILALLYAVPPAGFLALVYVAVGVGAAELASMAMPRHRVLQAWTIVAAAGLFSVLYFAPAHLATAVMVVALAGLLVGLAAAEPMDGAHAALGWLVAGPLYVALPLFAIVDLHRLPNGASWVLLTMALAWAGDTAAYFTGRAVGRTKLSRISPKKTVEGALGGLVGSAIGAVTVHFMVLPELPVPAALLLGVVAGVLGQAGDLCESLIKRATGTKDSGWILPGHGGILDRIDGLMFTGAATWGYVTWLRP